MLIFREQGILPYCLIAAFRAHFPCCPLTRSPTTSIPPSFHVLKYGSPWRHNVCPRCVAMLCGRQPQVHPVTRMCARYGTDKSVEHQPRTSLGRVLTILKLRTETTTVRKCGSVHRVYRLSFTIIVRLESLMDWTRAERVFDKCPSSR